MHPVISLVEVSKTFYQAQNTVSVIKNANLSLAKGELVCLVGPSGSGKTTILQIAGLLDSPTSGKVFISNREVTSADDKTRTELRKKHIGFIYQFHHLMPEFSALENVALPLLIQGENKKIAFEKAKEILSEVQLDDRLNFKPFQLSGGQQQRVAIARAIVGKPQLILADEPTGNLDYELTDKIFSLLILLTKRYEIAFLLVSHNFELANRCDRILRIKDGILV
jgi:lipoprotein-releasing system ATP-binding protein